MEKLVIISCMFVTTRGTQTDRSQSENS